jgi:hypothetical protein
MRLARGHYFLRHKVHRLDSIHIVDRSATDRQSRQQSDHPAQACSPV